MKKIILATAAAAALVTGAASWQPADAQTRYVVRQSDGYVDGWNNPVAWGAGAIVGTAAAIATAPVWAAASAPYYYADDYDYYPAYSPAYGYEYGYDYGYPDPVYAPAPVIYTTRVAPRRVIYERRVVVAPRRVVPRTIVRTERPIRTQRHAVRTIRY